MKTELTHITKVKITKLWGEDLNFEWHLNPDVNVLAGDNGSGKSTILNLIVGLLTGADNFPKDVINFTYGIWIEFNNSSIVSMKRIRDSIENLEEKARRGDDLIGENLSNLKTGEGKNYQKLGEIDISYPTVNGKPVKIGSEELKGLIRLDSISTFDQPLFPIEVLQKRAGDDAETYLDFLIERLEKKYLNYQVDIGRRALEALSSDGAEEVHATRQRIDTKKSLFLDLMDDLFSHTQKRIDRHVNGISFLKPPKQVISPYHLSSGEKQMLIILLTALVQDNQPAVMILDEPELSLHTDWQEKLIDNIRNLNEHVQIIIATHSPSIIINGWQDKVFETVDIQVKK